MPINSDRPVSVVRATVVCEYVRTSDVRGRRRSSRGRGPRVLPLPVLIRRFVVVVVVVVIAVIAVAVPVAVSVAVAVALALVVSCRDSAVQLWWWWFRVHTGAYLVVIVVNHSAGADNWRSARRLESRSQRQQPTSRPREWRAAASRSSSLPRTSAASSRRYVTYVTLIARRGEARRGRSIDFRVPSISCRLFAPCPVRRTTYLPAAAAAAAVLLASLVGAGRRVCRESLVYPCTHTVPSFSTRAKQSVLSVVLLLVRPRAREKKKKKRQVGPRDDIFKSG